MDGQTQYQIDMDYIATFEKECRKDDDFFSLNPKAWEHVQFLYKKYRKDRFATGKQ
tara:strand:+ start:816 stop:983 length:168 start_codon:yes stop_codon:yes gene_type:complete